MSLINEALKRAESDKLRHAAFASNPTMVPPTENEPPPPPRPMHAATGRRWPIAAMTALAAVTIGTAVTWHFWAALTGPGAPQVAAADPTTRPADRPRTDAGEGSPQAPKPARPPAKPITVGPEAELAFARTVEALEYYQPPSPPVPPVAAEPTPQPAARPARQADPATRPARPSPAPVPPAPPAARPAPPGRFRLSAIMQGPGGGAAIINGSLVHPGQTIDGAKVIRIDKYTVELEVQGQRLAIRM